MLEYYKSSEFLAAKQDKWKKVGQEVDTLEDRLGEPIEEGIKETVIALRVYDFPTNQSCEGHDDHGFSYPWVLIQSESPAGWEADERLQQQWREENEKLAQRMRSLLDDFYAHRDVDENVQLRLVAQGMFGAFRLQSAEDDEEGGEKYLPRRREEMRQFTQRLKTKFFESDS